MLLGVRDVKRYHRSKLLLSLLDSTILLAYAGLWVLWGGETLAHITDNRWLSLLIFVGLFGLIYEVATLPLNYYGDFVLEHRYELSNQRFMRWFTQLLKSWCVGGLIGGIVLAGLYALLWYAGNWWWCWVWLSWIGFTVLLAQLFPVLLLPVFYKSTPLEDQAITSGLEKLAKDTSLRINGIFELDLSTDTKAANAMLTGLGSTRRVYLSDTLLEAFTPEEIEVVFAHELGHHVHKHIRKSIVLSALFSTFLIAVLVYFLHPLRGVAVELWPAAVAVVPKIVLGMALVSLITKPMHNAISRRFERQCDRGALDRTQNPKSYRSAFNKLAEMNLADPDPHPFIEWYFYDHPAMVKRIALADRFCIHDKTVDV